MASHKFAARLRVIGLPGHHLTEMQEGQLNQRGRYRPDYQGVRQALSA